MRLIPYNKRIDLPSPFLETSHFLEDFFSDFPFSARLGRANEAWLPAVDILEKDGNLILKAELPGINEKDIELKLEGKVLTLKGERKSDTKESRDQYHRRETVYGSFSRSFTLPEAVETDKITAAYKNGVLTVTLPQKSEAKPREIPVSVS